MLEKKLTNRFRRTFWHPAARSGSSGRRKQGHFKPVRNCKGKKSKSKTADYILKSIFPLKPDISKLKPADFHSDQSCNNAENFCDYIVCNYCLVSTDK